MKRSITYRGIKEIVYTLSEADLNNCALTFIKKSNFFVTSESPSTYKYEWCDTERGKVYLEVTQEIIKEEKKG